MIENPARGTLESAKAPFVAVGSPSQARTVVAVVCTAAIRTPLFRNASSCASRVSCSALVRRSSPSRPRRQDIGFIVLLHLASGYLPFRALGERSVAKKKLNWTVCPQSADWQLSPVGWALRTRSRMVRWDGPGTRCHSEARTVESALEPDLRNRNGAFAGACRKLAAIPTGCEGVKKCQGRRRRLAHCWSLPKACGGPRKSGFECTGTGNTSTWVSTRHAWARALRLSQRSTRSLKTP